MTIAVLTAVIAFTPVQKQLLTGETFVTEKHLGKAGYKAFTDPESVTIQRVYSPSALLNRTRKQALAKSLHTAGDEHEIAKRHFAALVHDLSLPRNDAMPLCVFHPDHVLRFRKGETCVEIVTCFSCHVLNVVIDGKLVGTTNFPSSQILDEVRALVPLVEDQRAIFDETLGTGFRDALAAVTSGTIERVVFEGRIEPDPKWEPIGPVRKLDTATVAELRTVILTSALVSTKPLLVYGLERPALVSNVVIELRGKETIHVLLPQKDAEPAYASWRGATSMLPKGLALRCAIDERVKALLEGQD